LSLIFPQKVDLSAKICSKKVRLIKEIMKSIHTYACMAS
jgi:hypothetical protein